MDAERRKMLFSIFMALLIIGSILSLVINPRGRTREQQATGVAQTPMPPKALFKAENIDANIEQLTSSYRIYGYTDNYNTYELLEQIRAIDGIKELYNPTYRESKQKDQKEVLFVFDATLESDYNIEQIFTALEEKGILSEVGAYRKAMVKIPQEIQLKAVDGNITKNVSFDTPFVVALVGLNSEPGDRLKITLYTQLQGDTPLKNTVEAFEEQNLSATPAFFEQDFNASILSLKNKLIISEEIAYNGFSLDSLKSDLNALPDVNELTITAYLMSDSFTVKLLNGLNADLNIESFLADLNASKQEPIKNIELSSNHGNADGNAILIEVSFDSSSAENYASAKQMLASMLSNKGISFEISDLNAFFNINITTSSGLEGKHAEALAEKISSVLASYGVHLSESSFVQEATLDINSVKRPDTNVLIPVREPVEARLFIGHNIGDVVEVRVSFYAVRDELLYIQAVEKALANIQPANPL